MPAQNKSKKKRKDHQQNRCPYCGAGLQMVEVGRMGFPKIPENGPEYYWRCSCYPACNTYISADQKTKAPNGRIANERLRRNRMIIHSWQTIFDSSGLMNANNFRSTYIASELGINRGELAHVRNLDDAQSERVLKRLERVYHTEKKVQEIIDKSKYSMAWRYVRGVAYEKGAFFDEEGRVAEDAPEWFEKTRSEYVPLVSNTANAKEINRKQRENLRNIARNNRINERNNAILEQPD